jgi:hypothetical protein
MIIVISAIAVVVVLAGIGVLIALNTGGGKPSAGNSPSSGPVTSSVPVAPASSSAPSPSVSSLPTAPVFNPQVGDCVHNSGTFTSPILETVNCGGANANYRVLKRINGTTNRHLCDSVSGANYEVDIPTQDFVLCLEST